MCGKNVINILILYISTYLLREKKKLILQKLQFFKYTLGAINIC